MLDAYIIDRIRREREAPADRRVPLHIEVPREAPREAPRGRTRPGHEPEPFSPEDEAPSRDEDRGVAIIDFTI
jgi:hypothetical protein